jgi:hypothetical protein
MASYIPRLLIVCWLQATFALTAKYQLVPHLDTYTPKSYDAQVYSGMMFVGSFISIFYVDSLRRKTILKDFLPLLGLFSIVSGILMLQSTFRYSAILYIQYVLVGMTLAGVMWLVVVEVFPYPQRLPSVAVSFMVYHLVTFALIKGGPSLEVIEFILGGSCMLLGVVMFLFMASTPSKAIRLKSEKKKYQMMMKSIRSQRGSMRASRRRGRSVGSSVASGIRHRPLRLDSNPLAPEMEIDVDGNEYHEFVDNDQSSQDKEKSQ